MGPRDVGTFETYFAFDATPGLVPIDPTIESADSRLIPYLKLESNLKRPLSRNE